MSLLLLSLRARCHGRKQRAGTTGDELGQRTRDRAGVFVVDLSCVAGCGGRAGTLLLGGLARRLGD